MKPFPDFKTRSEIGRVFYNCMLKGPHCNEVQTHRELGNKIYNRINPREVIRTIMQGMNE